MVKKIFKILSIVILALGALATSLYFIFIYQKPIDKEALAKFLEGQPIIDTHVHITKGYDDSKEYNNLDPNIDIAKIKWTSAELEKHNVVLALAGGTLGHLKHWTDVDDKYWAGLIFPCSQLVEQDEPCEQEFYDYSELQDIYTDSTLRSMGESMFNYYGISPTDERLEPYWKFASDRELPIGVHADSGPPSVDEKERPNYRPDYANPDLLKPILEKYPNLRINLMHFGGEYSQASMDLMKQYPQIYCDMTAITLFAPKFIWEPNIKMLFEAGLGDRLMFGSDYHGTIQENIEIVFQLTWLTDDEKRDIYYNNAARYLQLSQEEIARHHEMVP